MAAISSGAAGKRPRSRSRIPAAIGSSALNSLTSVLSRPEVVLIPAYVLWSVIQRAPAGTAIRGSTSGCASCAAWAGDPGFAVCAADAWSPEGDWNTGSAPIPALLNRASAAPMSRVTFWSVVRCALRMVMSAALTPVIGSAIIATTSRLRPLDRQASRRAMRTATRQEWKRPAPGGRPDGPAGAAAGAAGPVDSAAGAVRALTGPHHRSAGTPRRSAASCRRRSRPAGRPPGPPRRRTAARA